MIEPKDKQLVNELINATKAGKIRWIPTAIPGEFTASFRGKFSVVISGKNRITPRGPSIPAERMAVYDLTLRDDTGRLLQMIDDPSVIELWEVAQRPKALAEKAVDEIIEELRGR